MSNNDTSANDDDVTSDSEEDPQRLWCICNKPYNNRFMLCCDKCDQWFHGSCVGVTRRQGKNIEREKLDWCCPNCSKEVTATGLTDDVEDKVKDKVEDEVKDIVEDKVKDMVEDKVKVEDEVEDTVKDKVVKHSGMDTTVRTISVKVMCADGTVSLVSKKVICKVVDANVVDKTAGSVIGSVDKTKPVPNIVDISSQSVKVVSKGEKPATVTGDVHSSVKLCASESVLAADDDLKKEEATVKTTEKNKEHRKSKTVRKIIFL